MAILPAAGCSSRDKDRAEILKSLKIRSSALNSGDMPQYLSVVSPRYNDKGRDFLRLKESLEKRFGEFGQISYEAERPTITLLGNSAESAGSYRMKIKVRGKEITLNGTEHLRLAKEPEGWKIIAGI